MSALKKILLFIGAALAGAFLFVMTGLGRAGRKSIADLGKPTPEEARVQIERAETKANTETETKAEEIRNAPIDTKLSRLRDLARRGRLRG